MTIPKVTFNGEQKTFNLWEVIKLLMVIIPIIYAFTRMETRLDIMHTMILEKFAYYEKETARKHERLLELERRQERVIEKLNEIKR